MIEAAPDTREMFVAWRQHYPQHYHTLLETIIDAYEQFGEREATRQAFYATRSFMMGRVGAISNAPSDTLLEIGRVQAEFARFLQVQDLTACARWYVSGFTPDTLPTRSAAALVSHLNALFVRAASEGERARVRRPADISDELALAWVDQLSAISPSSAQLLRNGFERGHPSQLCAAAVATYEAALRLPREQAAEVLAYLIRESLVPGDDPYAPPSS